MKWPVKHDALLDARRDSQSDNKRLLWEYECRVCKRWFPGKEVQVDHIKPVGNMDDMNVFVGRLFCEITDLRVLCRDCHQAKTNAERAERKKNAQSR